MAKEGEREMPLSGGAHLSPEVLEQLSRPTLPMSLAGRLLFDIGPGASYAAARKGDLPSIKIGRKLFVPTGALRKMLGLDEPQQTA